MIRATGLAKRYEGRTVRASPLVSYSLRNQEPSGRIEVNRLPTESKMLVVVKFKPPGSMTSESRKSL